MKFSKINLSNLVGISHSDDHLGLLINRGDSVEYIEIPAPVEAYEGLQELNCVVESELQLPEMQQPIAMLPAHSTMANAVGYDAQENLLQVEFSCGAVYQYEDVDEETWEALQESESVGRFFNQEIKGYYESRRVI